MRRRFMAERLNADEVFEMACHIERNGAKFYRRAALLAGDADARALLDELAAMEEQHERDFTALRERLRKEQPEWRSPMTDASAETDPSLYLRAAAEGHVFDVRSDPADQLTESDSLASILQVAIGLEKDSVVYYVGIKEAMPPKLGREKLDEIIRQEMGHITMLSSQLASLAE
jgi:rubrerythrin